MTPSQIRRLRKRLGMSQPEFARELGTAEAVVSRWENGRATPRSMSLRALVNLRDRTARSN